MLSLRSMNELRRLVVPLALALLLNACGGGGGGGGGNQPAPQPNGSFTINATSATFSMLQGNPAAQQTINLTVTNSTSVAGVGAAFPAARGVSQWLNVGITGTMPNFVVNVQPNTFPIPGHYTATLLVGTGDANGNVLQSKSIAVTLDVTAPLQVHTTVLPGSFIFGHATTTMPVPLSVTADNGSTWKVTSTVPWITGPANNTGSQNVNATVDVSTLAVGTHNGFVTVQSTQFPADTQDIPVSVTVVAPTLTVTTPNVVLGGTDGLSAAPQPFTATLNTGANAYPFTVVLAENQALGWLKTSAPTGTVSETQNATVNLSFDRTKVTPGVYTGTARFDVTVKGVVFTASAPVTLNVESHRLYPEYDGVALSKFPTRQRLTRTMRVLSSRDRLNVPWTATSDQAWLSVTSSGVTGGDLTLTANPQLVPSQNQSHIAIVTLASTDPTIERTEKIRVGMWVGSSDPPAHLTTPNLPGQGVRALAVNPVEPLAYSVSFSGTLPFESDKIRIHNAYTGAASTPIDLPGSEIWSIGVSSDGRLLFAFDHISKKVFVMNAATGAPITTYQSFDPNGAPHGFLSVRPNGFPIIWTPIGEAFDTETHERIFMTVNGNISTATSFPVMRAATPDSKRVIVGEPGCCFSRALSIVDQYFTVLGGKKLQFTTGFTTPNDPSSTSPWDMAFGASGQRVFINDESFAGKAYQNNSDTLTPLPSFPVAVGSIVGILSIESTWDGRVFYQTSWVATGMPDTTDNVYVFDELGNSLGSFRFGTNQGGTTRASFGISGDLLRMVSTEGIPNGLNSPVEHVMTFDDVP